MLFTHKFRTLLSMDKLLASITTDQIDENSLKLLAEWKAHFEQMKRNRPDMADAGEVGEKIAFQSWITQKVSYLQLQMIEIMGQVERLRNNRQ